VAEGLILIDVGLNGYTPGQTYPLSVVCTDIIADKLGFQITSETAAAKAGTWVITNASRTQMVGGTAVTHTAAGTDPVGTPNVWSMNWTAPEAGTGPVSFYVAVNKTNSNNSNQGDQIFISSLTIQESNVGIAENFEALVGQIYPNPATESIKLNLPLHAKVQVFDNIGREVMSFTANTEDLQIDVSGLEHGIYHMNFSKDGNYASRSFIKK